MDFWSIQVPIPVALAVVATLGYLFGRRSKRGGEDSVHRSRRELRRAHAVATELERIACQVRKSLSRHQASLAKFKSRVDKLGDRQQEAAWKELCREVEEILKPTLHLASQMAGAYDEIRQQSANLMTFTEVRTDSLTGLNNRRGLDDALAAQFAMMNRYNALFSVAMIDIDHFKQINDREGHLYGDKVLQDLARLVDECVRETDVVARYGGEEFVIVMPQTELLGACVFAERFRCQVAQKTDITVSIGLAAATGGDTQESLLARADSSLYSAKAAGRNCVWRHNGEQVEPVVEEVDLADICEGRM